MINNNEIIYKMEAIIEYLKNNDGYNYELYNKIKGLYELTSFALIFFNLVFYLMSPKWDSHH